MIAPATFTGYALLTWDAANRPAMVGIAVAMFAVTLLSWALPTWLARARARVPVQLLGALVNIAGSAAVGVLDGGVLSPAGTSVLFGLLIYATAVPPRAFYPILVLSVGGYLATAAAGEPAPPGYVPVFVLGFVAASVLCLRHAGAVAALRRRLARIARVDPLTTALNRRGFAEQLARDVARSAGSGAPLTLVLADLNRFKEINDLHGHRAGDGLLAWVAAALREAAGPGAAVGRPGGDEFAVLVPGLGPEEAPALVERLRAALAGTAPAALGSACLPAEAATAEELMRLADHRAYADKATSPRGLPAASAVQAAAACAPASPPRAVSRRERRRRALRDLGVIDVVNNSIGLLYVAFLAEPANRTGLAVVLGVGWLGGLGLVAGADLLSRPARGRIVDVISVVLFALAGAAVVLDGGLGSPMALGLLAPLPLLALAIPVRTSAPVIAAVAALYVAIGAVAGSPGGWYVAMHLLGMGAAAVACGIQGRDWADRRARLRHLSRVDVLTDALNRRGFAETFATELARGRGLALLVLDLDGFKQVNDSEGHAAGDDLLRWVASTARDVVRAGDGVGRLGGDEFVVLLAGEDAAGARATAERLRSALAARTGVSIGVAVLGGDGDDFDALYGHADAALYREKTARRATRSVA